MFNKIGKFVVQQLIGVSDNKTENSWHDVRTHALQSDAEQHMEKLLNGFAANKIIHMFRIVQVIDEKSTY